MNTPLPTLALVALLTACGASPTPAPSTPTPTPTPAPATTPHPGPARQDVIRRSGAGLVIGADARPIVLRGVSFGNEVWGNPSLAPRRITTRPTTAASPPWT